MERPPRRHVLLAICGNVGRPRDSHCAVARAARTAWGAALLALRGRPLLLAGHPGDEVGDLLRARQPDSADLIARVRVVACQERRGNRDAEADVDDQEDHPEGLAAGARLGLKRRPRTRRAASHGDEEHAEPEHHPERDEQNRPKHVGGHLIVRGAWMERAFGAARYIPLNVRNGYSAVKSHSSAPIQNATRTRGILGVASNRETARYSPGITTTM